VITPARTTRSLIDGLVESTGVSDPVAAIRLKAAQVIDSFVAIFGEPDPFPLDLVALASFLGIKQSDAPPTFSPDAELAPDGSGGVEMRVNPDRPETRRRFSIGHEITHTFFPEYTSHVWPRADSRHRDLQDPDDYLEMLCDVGAAELVFPRKWFKRDAIRFENARGIAKLAERYQASREATMRRYAELHCDSVAAVFFSWKLKPTEKGRLGRAEQTNLLGIRPSEELRDALRLRVQYTVPSISFSSAGHFVPRDKSVKNRGPIYSAASTGEPTDGEAELELGQARGTYGIHAIPLWTPIDERGPNGEFAVASIIRPLTTMPTIVKTFRGGPGLFD